MSNFEKENALLLSVKAYNWKMYEENGEDSDPQFQHAKKRALERDNRTCQICNFKAPKWQEVHHIDNDHSNNSLDNLATICSFCHMCQHIGLAGKNKEGVLIFLPEISQDKLHHIVRSILVAEQWSNNLINDKRNFRPELTKGAKQMKEVAESLKVKLLSRESEAERLIGTSDPLDLANVLLQMDDKIYQKRNEFLFGIRLLPNGSKFFGNLDKMLEIVKSWSETGGPYASLTPRSWHSLLKSMEIN
jgi:intracellular multiplication protein IcmJ